MKLLKFNKMDNKRIILYSYNSNILFLLLFSFFNISYCIIDIFHFHRSTKLNNGNFLLFSCKGMYLLSSDLSTIIYNSSITIDNYQENIVHFSDKGGGYILYISRTNHYLFSQDGNFIKNYKYDLSNRYYYYIQLFLKNF